MKIRFAIHSNNIRVKRKHVEYTKLKAKRSHSCPTYVFRERFHCWKKLFDSVLRSASSNVWHSNIIWRYLLLYNFEIISISKTYLSHLKVCFLVLQYLWGFFSGLIHSSKFVSYFEFSRVFFRSNPTGRIISKLCIWCREICTVGVTKWDTWVCFPEGDADVTCLYEVLFQVDRRDELCTFFKYKIMPYRRNIIYLVIVYNFMVKGKSIKRSGWYMWSRIC